MTAAKARVAALRKLMRREGVDAIYLSGTDPHMNEYLPCRWQVRAFLSGFTGSFGTMVVTASHAGLWTDTRYFLQAVAEIQESGFQLHKLRIPGAVAPEEWIASELPPGSRVGFQPETVPVAVIRNMESKLLRAGISLVPIPDLVDEIWDDRPPLPGNLVFEHDSKYSGLTRKEKFDSIRAGLRLQGADMQVISMLDELAWTFSLRGSDIAYNPVFYGFGVIGENRQVLFTEEIKIPGELKNKLLSEGIELLPYASFPDWLRQLENLRVLIDPVSTGYAILKKIESKCSVAEGSSVPLLLKSRKNGIEIDGFRSVMRRDGVALVKFLFWLRNNCGHIRISEFTVRQKLLEFRGENEGFAGESFPAITGYKEHGAMVHFIVNEENAFDLEAAGLLLSDSGGQYPCGTTDITRTVVLGEITEQQRTDFTLVLKGLIALSQVRFPEGIRGCQLDTLARGPLWEAGLNYGHGTGHGVGHFLNVHEGPASIRPEYNPTVIEPGMVLTIEPGLYREGEYGIRTENMVVCVEAGTTRFGRFFRFDTLTLCPVDTKGISIEMMTDGEIDWLNQYHLRVRGELLPLLPDYLKPFLSEITSPVYRSGNGRVK